MGFRRAPAALVLLALAAPASAHADGKPYFDATRGDRPARERTPAQTLTKRLGTQAVVDVDTATGTPRVLGRLNGTLTGPASGSAIEIADAYVHAHLSDLGLSSSDLDTLGTPSSATSPSGLTEVRWAQSLDGIPSANSELRVNVTRDGRILSVLGSPAHAMAVDSTKPALDASEAIRAVQHNVGASGLVQKTKGPSGATQSTAFRGGSSAELQLLQRADGTALVWRVLYKAAPDAVYDATVDARTGEVLKRANMTKSDNAAVVWDRYANSSPRPLADLTNNGNWLANAATKLDGPFVHAWSDVADDDVAAPGEEVNRNLGGNWEYPFTPAAGATCTSAHQCAWSGGTTWTTNRAQTTVQAFYFANRFHDHLAAAPIGFNGFENVDKLLLQTDDGASTNAGAPNSAHLNNANMFTPPEGQSPTMQMYLFTGDGFRNVSGADDAAIVYHEYTHGLSSRLITDAAGRQAVNSPQAGAMGEAWSDWYALDFLVDDGKQADTAADGDLDMGEGTDLTANRLRSEPIDCPAKIAVSECPGTPRTGPGGYTYEDFGRIFGLPEVHADGEIWAQTLWDLRAALGSPLAEQLITDAMRLSPPEPSFLDERNAILQADINLGGTHLAQIWTVFAHRGMGFYAVSFDGGDVHPMEDFRMPPAANTPTGSIAGTVTNAETNAPLANAKVGISGLSSGAVNFSGKTDANGNYVIGGVPVGTYRQLNFTFDGFDPVSRGSIGSVKDDPDVVVLDGQTTVRSAIMRRNWASLKGGGQVFDFNHDEFAGLGCGPEGALDQSLGTGWSSQNVAPNPFLVVKLPQTITVRTFGVDPGPTCGDGFADSTSGVQVDTTTNSNCNGLAASSTKSFGTDAGGTINEFSPQAGTATARCVRLTLTSSFGGSFRDVSEFGVYTAPTPDQPKAVNPTPTPAPTPTSTVTPAPTPTVVPTPTPPVATVSIKLPSSGTKSSARVSFSCSAQCTATATLTADRATAKKLKLTTLGKAAKAGTGSLRFTVKLSPKAIKALKKRHLKSVTVKLKVSVRMNGRTTTSSRRVKIKL